MFTLTLMSEEIDTYIYNDEIIYNHKELDLDFLEVGKNCNECNPKTDYVCWFCEEAQVPLDAKYTDDCRWVVEIERNS